MLTHVVLPAALLWLIHWESGPLMVKHTAVNCLWISIVLEQF